MNYPFYPTRPAPEYVEKQDLDHALQVMFETVQKVVGSISFLNKKIENVKNDMSLLYTILDKQQKQINELKR
jgi:hypothetical protein